MIIPRRYENAKWEDVPPVIKKAFEGMLEGGKSIYIHGAVGTGKTHICWAIKKNSSDPKKYRFVSLWNMVDLLHEIRKDFDRQPYEKVHPEEEVTRSDSNRILILDDIGTEKASEFVIETIYRIINFRYVHMLPTIITSNCTIQELADKIGERSASRIVEMCDIIELAGDDRRIKK